MIKTQGLLAQTATYGCAIAVAIITGQQVDHLHPLWIVAIADAAATATVFLFSMYFNNSSMYDPYWSVKPMVIAAYFLSLTDGDPTIRAWVVFGLMLLYGIRLTSNFLRDWPGLHHEDWRYRNFRAQFPKLYWLISFSGIHFFPTLLVYLACIPSYYAIVANDHSMQWLDFLGIVIFGGSIVLSFAADEQMRRFRSIPANKGKIMDQQLWKYTRHPNYLGEVLGWWGLFCFALAVNTEYYWTGAGAVAITLLFYFISIPFMDKRSAERRPGFREYMKKSSSLFPFVYFSRRRA